MYRALVGTAKGLVVYQISEDFHTIQAVHFKGFSVNLVYIDERNGRWWAGVAHKHWGQKLHFSDDEGQHWVQAKTPSFEDAILPSGQKARLREIWCMEQGGKDNPDVLWMGTDPGGLFKSEDGGETFQLVESLWNHPSRKKPEQWFGAGSDYPFIHTVIVAPDNSNRIIIAVSCAGIFESLDGGKSWNPKNNGLKAAYLPNPNVEIGHDPHCVLMHPENTNILWQQNHCGVFYTLNGGEQWIDVSNHEDIPYYGFAMAIDENDPSCAWVLPVESDEQRVAPNLNLKVFFTNDFGKTWRSQGKGLPDGISFDIVLRKGFVKKGQLMLFGTTNGNIYRSLNKGAEWVKMETQLTKVNTVYIE